VCGVQVVYAEQVELEVSTTKGAAGQRIPQAGQAHSSVGPYPVTLTQRSRQGFLVVRSWYLLYLYIKYGTKYLVGPETENELL
jgi:hypothetical protein